MGFGIGTFELSCRRKIPGWLHRGGDVAGVAPGQTFEAEIKDAVEFVEGDAHVESDFGGGEPGSLVFLHYRKRIDIEPAGGFTIDCSNGALLFSFEAPAERDDPIFDEVEPSSLHDVIFCMIRCGDDFFRDPEGRTNFGAREFPVLEKLQITAGELWLLDLGTAPEEQRTIGITGFPLARFDCGHELASLIVGKLLIGVDDGADIGVVFHQAFHERTSGVIRVRSEFGGVEWGHAAPEAERVGQAFEPNFAREKYLRLHGSFAAEAGVAPADEFMIVNDVLEVGGVENEYLGKLALFEHGDAEAFAAQHEPDDAELPILKAIQMRVGMGVKVRKGAGGDEVFPAAVAGREEKGNVRDLLGDDIDGAIDPDYLLISVGENWTGSFSAIAGEPSL